jgi:hypothetical protein
MPFDSNGIWSLTAGYLGVTGQTILPSNHNPPLEDIRDNGLSAVLVRDGRAPMTGPLNMGTTNKIVNLAAGSSPADGVNFSQLSTITLSGAQNQGMLYGLTLSNNGADVTNDIDIAVGNAASDTTPFNVMSLASTLTKRLDAAWAVGTNQGGLDTGSIANTTYHVWLIQRSDTGVVDALFSTSATAPTMPTNYDRKRRIGSILRESAAIVLFFQNGDIFRRVTAATDRNNTVPVASTLLTLSIPAGIVIQPICRAFLSVGASVSANMAFGSAAAGTADTTVIQASTGAGDTSDISSIIIPTVFSTNTSAQVYFSATNSVGTPSSAVISTMGWVDTRGNI